ncbi:TBC domain-containing protein kinase-like protein [Cotesia glomerata]|uniref:TBC domain-containing protein kinase-like protein n=1 Tax=Cotesia glomerata TaxID=32391 RepID=UPI001D02DC35|nr:TBC domain-containing protein kinase-like protein [Cotesia glomerata]XP_044579741.1 TBC domain-containing protein kinase-like protein [Cotesia glomerata]
MEINNNNDNNSNSDENKKKGINSNSGPISNTPHTIVNKNAFISTQKTNGEKNNDKTNGIIIEEPACQNCCIACRSQRQQILRKLYSILMQLQCLNIVQNKSSIGTVSALPGFTIKTLIVLQELNQKLVENEEARAQFTNLIQLRRVPDGKKHIRDVLSYILDDELSRKLSWSDQKKTIAVKDMTFTKLLTDAIINLNPQCSLSDLNGQIKTWLQHASDRIKCVNVKHQAKN